MILVRTMKLSYAFSEFTDGFPLKVSLEIRDYLILVQLLHYCISEQLYFMDLIHILTVLYYKMYIQLCYCVLKKEADKHAILNLNLVLSLIMLLQP